MADEPIDELAQEQQAEAQEDRKRAEVARSVYEDIWEKFSVDRKKSRSLAYRNLQRRLSMNAATLVPSYLTAKEHMSMIADIEDWTKAEKESDTGDPSELMAKWLRGESELSRTPLEAIRKQ
jgi:hypothetical protein